MKLCLTATNLFWLLMLPLLAHGQLQVRHYQSHIRYEFGAQLLQLALQKSGEDFVIQHSNPDGRINEGRGELMVINGQLDVQWLSATAKREQAMIPIAIPIYRGLLGLRLLLVHNDNSGEFAAVRSLAQLQTFTAGHGKHWADLSVYGANQLPVKTHVSYQALFAQLKQKRFDYFHRGINEIWPEYEQHKSQLSIAKNVMLYYPQPVYFFVSKHHPSLAKALQRGLEKALGDGSFKTLFLEYFGDHIERAQLWQRTLIPLHNPNVPTGAHKLDRSWWLKPSPSQ